jgi:hypothetical protein
VPPELHKFAAEAESIFFRQALRNWLTIKKQVLRQDGLLGFQIFFNGFYAIAGIGDADGVGPAQFVMHQQLANHDHLKIRFRHAPELSGFQGLLANAGRRLDFLHGQSCALTFD